MQLVRGCRKVGLKYVTCREWAIVDADGEALTQKKLPKLATIRPSIDLQKGSIRLEEQWN